MLLEPAFLAELQLAAWPGNVRQLRNHVLRCLALEEDFPISDPGTGAALQPVDACVAYAESRRRALVDFERRYVRALLDLHGGRITEAARAAGIARPYLHRLLCRHGVG